MPPLRRARDDSSVETPEHARRRTLVGPISLAVSAAGFCGLEIAHAVAGLNGWGWVLVRHGFEAAVIGGVADWFAVRALFHPVPGPPLPALPHTNLVLANRQKLTDGLIDLVQNQLLSPASVKAQLRELSASNLLITHLDSVSVREHASRALLLLAGRMAEGLDDPKLHSIVSDVLRERVREMELAPLIGDWLLLRVAAGDTHAMWMAIADALAAEAERGGFDRFLEEAIVVAVAAVKEESWFKGQAASLFLRPKKDALLLRNAIAKTLREVALAERHPLAAKLDAAVADFAGRLIAQEPAATGRIRGLQARIAEHANFELLVGHMLVDLKRVVALHLSTNSEELRVAVDNMLTRAIDGLRRNKEAQEKLDDWFRDSISELAQRYHSVIGDTARKSIDRLPGAELVAELEAKVGQDIQFIRLNGAVVGGLVGVVLGAIRMLSG